jgi:hypothetical protein
MPISNSEHIIQVRNRAAEVAIFALEKLCEDDYEDAGLLHNDIVAINDMIAKIVDP